MFFKNSEILQKYFAVKTLLTVYENYLADKIVTVAPRLPEYIQKIGINPQKVAVVPNGVNIEHFLPLDKEQCKQELDLDENLTAVDLCLRNFLNKSFKLKDRECNFKGMNIQE